MCFYKTNSCRGKPEDWERLRELCRDLVALRKGDHAAERLKIERERIRLGTGAVAGQRRG